MKFPNGFSFSLLAFIWCSSSASAIDDYELGPDSMFHPEVPHGLVTKHGWSESKVFPGTVRDYWIYVPAQYEATKPARVMVF